MTQIESEFDRHVVEMAEQATEHAITGLELIRHFNGLHPIELRRTLLRSGSAELDRRAFGPVSSKIPRILEITREDNPVLSFWPFTPHSAAKITALAKNHSKIALLGTPTLLPLLVAQGVTGTTLFDSDPYFFKETTDGFVRCDIANDIPDQFNSTFDLVVADPPWYPEAYAAWVVVASKLLKSNGRLALVIFPDGVREAAKHERNEITALADEIFVKEALQIGAVEYQTPSFEKVQMVRAGILPVDWRCADLYIGRLRGTARLEPPRATPLDRRWTERRIGSGRLFVHMEARSSDDFLEWANPSDRFLSSPSRRDKGVARANVLSSRGHGLVCSAPQLLLSLIDEFNCGSPLDGSSTISSRSRAMLIELIEDLWPRYIFLP